jgi:hypothetical protein
MAVAGGTMDVMDHEHKHTYILYEVFTNMATEDSFEICLSN